MSSLNVVGIDPSLSNFGLVAGVVDLDTNKLIRVGELALVETEKAESKKVRVNSSDLERARKIHRDLHSFLQGASLAFVEIPVGSQSARAMASYGICIGILASINVPLIQVTPREVKLAATGDETATKQEMIQWAVSRFPDAKWLCRGGRATNNNEHLADATAAIVAGLLTDQYKQAAALARGFVKQTIG